MMTMDDEQTYISKSARKREALALQELGVALIRLRLDQIEKLPLSEALHVAIIDAKKLKSHGAIRRQAQLIGKLMRSADHEAIRVAYQNLFR